MVTTDTQQATRARSGGAEAAHGICDLVSNPLKRVRARVALVVDRVDGNRVEGDRRAMTHERFRGLADLEEHLGQRRDQVRPRDQRRHLRGLGDGQHDAPREILLGEGEVNRDVREVRVADDDVTGLDITLQGESLSDRRMTPARDCQVRGRQ